MAFKVTLRKITVNAAAWLLLAGAAASVALACMGAERALDFMKYYAAIAAVGGLAAVCLVAAAFTGRRPAVLALHLGLALVLGGWVYNELAGPRDGYLRLSADVPDESFRIGRVLTEGAPLREGFDLALDKFTIDRWPDTGTVRQYTSTGSTWTVDAVGKAHRSPVSISVNHPLVKNGWWIYQASFEELENPHTGAPLYFTILQCVKDVGLPYAALGGVLLILGALLYQFRVLAATRPLIRTTLPEKPSWRCRAVFGLYALVFAGAVAMLVDRTISTGHAPLQNMYEFLMCAAAFLPLRTFGGTRRSSERDRVRTLLVDAFLQALMLVAVCFFMDGSVKRLMPALQSPFFIPHVGAYVLGYIFLVRAAFGVGLRLVPTGFFLLTLGLVLGAAWGKVCWGHWWQFDPKEMWSLATWLVYAAYFHASPRLSARAQRAFLVAGAAMIVLTLTWINLSRIFTGMHSYA